MKVLTKNDLQNWERVITCRGCHSSLVIRTEDLYIKEKLKALVYKTLVRYGIYVNCPLCSYQTDVDENLVPDAIYDPKVSNFIAIMDTVEKERSNGRNHTYLILVAISLLLFIVGLCYFLIG